MLQVTHGIKISDTTGDSCVVFLLSAIITCLAHVPWHFLLCLYLSYCSVHIQKLLHSSCINALPETHVLQMLLEIQQMHDDVLEHKVNVAISSNRLTRLDNPIIHDKLKSLKRQAETIFQAAGMEE